MLPLKKKLLSQKIEKIISDNVFILIYQFHNVKTKQWNSLKFDLFQIEKTQTFIVKNKMVCNLLKKKLDLLKNGFFHNKKKQNIKSIFQGPTLIITCTSTTKIVKINVILNHYANFVFIGALFQNQFFSHLDLKKIVQLKESLDLQNLKFFDSKKPTPFTKNLDLCLDSSIKKLSIQLLHNFISKPLEYNLKIRELVFLLLAKQKQLVFSMQLKK